MFDKDKIQEVNNLIKECLLRNKTYSRGDVEFTGYCKEKMNYRNIDEGLVAGVLLGGRELYFVRVQKVEHRGVEEIRYKMIYKISGRYSLIVIVVYNKVLKVLNVIKTSKGAEKLWRKEMLK